MLAIVLALSILAGCVDEQAAEIAADARERELLAFLVDGETRKDEVLLRFGLPTGTFEGERILTYRMMLHSEKGFIPLRFPLWIVRPGPIGDVEADHQPGKAASWSGVYQTILVFDAKDVLVRHKLLKNRYVFGMKFMNF